MTEKEYIKWLRDFLSGTNIKDMKGDEALLDIGSQNYDFGGSEKN